MKRIIPASTTLKQKVRDEVFGSNGGARAQHRDVVEQGVHGVGELERFGGRLHAVPARTNSGSAK